MITEALDAAFDSASARLGGTTRAQFLAALKDFVCHPIEVNGKVEGAVLVDGPIIHACIKPAAFSKWLTRSRLETILLPIVDTHGYAETACAANNREGLFFVRRLGFKFYSQKDNIATFRAYPEDVARYRRNHGH